MSLYAILCHLSRWPCEPFKCANTLRNFQHKQISPCELRLTWLPCGPSIRCFSHTTESVFAFLIVNWIWTNSRLLHRELRYHYAITTYCDVLTLLLNTLLEYPIQHTTYLWSCGLLSRLLRSVSLLLGPPTTQTALPPLTATSWTITLPFLIPVGKLVLLWGQHHLLLSNHLGSPHLATRAFKQPFFPQHLLHSYNHRSYQWSLGHPIEQACIVGPLLAQACRTIVLWLPHGSYPKEAMPPNP